MKLGSAASRITFVTRMSVTPCASRGQNCVSAVAAFRYGEISVPESAGAEPGMKMLIE